MYKTDFMIVTNNSKNRNTKSDAQNDQYTFKPKTEEKGKISQK